MTEPTDVAATEPMPFTPPPPRPWWPWIAGVLLALGLGVAGYIGWSGGAPSPENVPPAVVNVPNQPAPGLPSAQAPALPPVAVATETEAAGPRKCVKGDETIYTDGPCPSGSTASMPDLSPAVQDPATAGREHIPLYRCQAKAGQFFWSRKTCSEWGAVVDRMTGVPKGWSFERQVALAEQRRRAAMPEVAVPAAPAPSPRTAAGDARPSKIDECRLLDQTIANIDALTRQVLDFRQLDQLRDERRRARDRQFAIGCGRP